MERIRSRMEDFLDLGRIIRRGDVLAFIETRFNAFIERFFLSDLVRDIDCPDGTGGELSGFNRSRELHENVVRFHFVDFVEDDECGIELLVDYLP